MPVVTISSLELDEKQKRTVAREYTRILSRATNVPEENIYIFFGGFPLSSIAAGGVLNSQLPDSLLANFNIKYSRHFEKEENVTVLTRMKAAAGREEEAERKTLGFVDETRREPGCLSYDLFRSRRNIYQNVRTSSYFVLQEKWKSQAAINEHLETPHFKDFMAKSSELFAGGFEVTAKISGPSRNSAEIAEGHTKLIVRMKAKPDKLEILRRGNLEMKRRLERRSGCLQYDLYQGFEGICDPSVFIADQTWEDRKSLDEAIDYILTEMPFYLEDLGETREPILFELDSELQREAGKDIRSVFENAVSGDQELIAGLTKMNPDFAKLCVETSEKAYQTPLIDQRTKVLFAIVVDVVEQIHGKPFENHLMMAKKQGVMKEELFELLLFLTIYVGFNKAGAYYNEVAKYYGS